MPIELSKEEPYLDRNVMALSSEMARSTSSLVVSLPMLKRTVLEARSSVTPDANNTAEALKHFQIREKSD